MSSGPPTILATSGGCVPGLRVAWEFGPLARYAVELAGVTGRAPRICLLATAAGDDLGATARFYAAASLRRWEGSHLALFPMPNYANMLEHLLAQDVVWVSGGSVAGLLAMWRLHGLDEVFRQVWQSGVILSGISAGSICWHVGGTTDSFGPELRPVTNGLGLLPYANGVHHNSDPQRRPLLSSLVAQGVLPGGYATDDGVGLLYRGTTLVEALSEKKGACAWSIMRDATGLVQEIALETRALG